MLLTINQSLLQKCLNESTFIEEITHVRLQPMLLLFFKNPIETLNSIQVKITPNTAIEENGIDMRPVYIIVGILGGALILFIFWVFMKQRQGSPQVISSDQLVVILNNKRQDNYNKYMPIKSLEEVMAEYPDLAMSTECQICLQKYENSDLCRVTICFHLFHQQCIDAWLLTKQSCPFCRVSLSITNIKKTIEFYKKQDLKNYPDHDNVQIKKVGQILDDKQISQAKSDSEIVSIVDNQYIRRIRINQHLAKNQLAQMNHYQNCEQNIINESPITNLRSDNLIFLNQQNSSSCLKMSPNEVIPSGENQNLVYLQLVPGQVQQSDEDLNVDVQEGIQQFAVKELEQIKESDSPQSIKQSKLSQNVKEKQEIKENLEEESQSQSSKKNNDQVQSQIHKPLKGRLSLED